MNNRNDNAITSWSDIDKVRFFGIGTIMYSGITVLLHPITVTKTRQQVQSNGSRKALSNVSISSAVRAGPELSLMPQLESQRSFEKIRSMYRGLGVVVSLAIPARALYIGVLEGSREGISNAMTRLTAPGEGASLFMTGVSSGSIATLSSGLAGGIAAISAQVLVVPMDVIAQRQMVNSGSCAMQECHSVLQSDGWRGLYRGFGISVFNALPTGMIWWATYGGCQHRMRNFVDSHFISSNSSDIFDSGFSLISRYGLVQIVSGLTAAAVASVTTQPLDVIKTRLQVSGGNAGMQQLSYMSVANDLMSTAGIQGFFRGTGPRIMHMGMWGTVLSSAYELLKYLSRKDV